MPESVRRLFSWLQDGAHVYVYVCGDELIKTHRYVWDVY
jgi:hypothetical protein